MYGNNLFITYFVIQINVYCKQMRFYLEKYTLLSPLLQDAIALLDIFTVLFI